MWLYYLLLTITAAAQADLLRGNRRHVSGFQWGPGPRAFMMQNVSKRQNTVKRQNIIITGTGTMNANGKTSLNINVQIAGSSSRKFPGVGTGGQHTESPGFPGFPEASEKGDFTPFELETLKEHNKFRGIHAAPPMTLDKTMCQEAAAYAAVIARRGGLQHSNTDQGENLSMGCSTNAGQTATEAVTNWYNEVCKPYVFGRPNYQSGTGHFTQVVWKASTKLGIGKADIERSGMKCTYIVGRYKPPGNFNTGNNDYQKNVLEGSFDQSYCETISNSPSWDQNLNPFTS